MKKLRHSAKSNTLRLVYLVVRKSVISYCIPIWGGAYKASMLKLERAQQVALKIMLCKPFRYPTTHLYQDCKVLALSQLFVHVIILLYHSPVLCANCNYAHMRRKPVYMKVQYRTIFGSCMSSYLYNKICR